MFKYQEDTKFQFMTAKTAIPDKWIGIKFAPAPRQASTNAPAGSDGARLVMQYAEGYVYRTYDLRRASDAQVQTLLSKARTADAADIGLDSDDYPRLETLMTACQTCGFVCDGTGGSKANLEVGYVKNATADLKYFVRQYGQLILETKLTSQTYNQDSYEISSVGDSIGFDDYSKGFIMYGYDKDYIYLQNSRGVRAGSLGFHKMKWSLVPNLVRRGACWRLRNPS